MRGFFGGYIHQDSRAFSDYMPETKEEATGKNFFIANCNTNGASSPDGRYAVAIFGVLDNAKALQQLLSQKGFSWSEADGDECLLAAAWQAWGSDCLPLLQGAFVCIVLDKYNQTLYLARDPLGQKQLYCYQDRQNFIFTTEIKTLIPEKALDLSLNQTALYHNLIFLYPPGEKTLFKNLTQLPPGCYGVYQSQTHHFSQHRYYRLPFNGQYNQRRSEQEWTDLLENQLLSSLKNQFAPGDRCALSLSGGLDSSLIAAMADKIPGLEKLFCFTIGNTAAMRQEGFGNDLSYAQQMAGRLSLQLEIVSGAWQLETELDRMIWLLEAPHGDPAAIHHLHLSEAAANAGFTTLLGGAAADDLFAGYRRHQALRWLFLSKAPAQFKSSLLVLAGLKSDAFKRRLSKLLGNTGSNREERMFANFFWLQPERASELFDASLQQELKQLDPFVFMRETLSEIPEEKSPLNQMLAFELRLFLGAHNLPYLQKLSNAAEIAVRSPYVSENLVAFTATLPPSLKLKGNTTKYLLKKVAERYLPQAIIYRKKTGFAAPIRSLLTGPSKGFVTERLLEGSLRGMEIFNEKELKKLIGANAAGTQDAAYPIFTLLAMESWLRQFAQA